MQLQYLTANATVYHQGENHWGNIFPYN